MLCRRYAFQSWTWDWPFIGCALLLTLVARACNIFPMSAAANLFRPKSSQITPAMMGAMWFAGLRGGVSFALVMVLDDRPDQVRRFDDAPRPASTHLASPRLG